MRFERMIALCFATLAAAMPGCITVNSPLFPGPVVVDRSCPQVVARPMAGGMPDTTPEAPMPEPAPVMVPRLQGPEPIEMQPAGRATGGGGRSRRLMAGE